MSGTPVPDSMLRSSKLMDGIVWDGRDPRAYAAAFPIRHRAQAPAETATF